MGQHTHSTKLIVPVGVLNPARSPAAAAAPVGVVGVLDPARSAAAATAAALALGGLD